jgi:hypothetical protein
MTIKIPITQAKLLKMQFSRYKPKYSIATNVVAKINAIDRSIALLLWCS